MQFYDISNVLRINFVFRLWKKITVLSIAPSLVILLLITSITSQPESNDKLPHSKVLQKKEELNSMKLPPCQACSTLVTSFQKAMKETEKHNFAGGDTAWEEEKLGKYLTSEIRLVEVQERLCSELEKAKDQCRSLAEEHEHLLEEWWSMQLEHPVLHDWLCISRLQVCCPEHRFGANCTECPGYPDNVCSRNGKCKGSGTRKGNGKCQCNPGYKGELCNTCMEGYHESYRDESKVLCSKCHTACAGSCDSGGPKGCAACKPGWMMHKELGCMDIDDCSSELSPCENKDTFCENNQGGYDCLDCDKSCNGCTGDGPAYCIQCKEGYVKHGGACVEHKWFLDRLISPDNVRYVTYFGLTVATCIILQKSLALAATFGVIVAAYIAVSEYTINRENMNAIGVPFADAL